MKKLSNIIRLSLLFALIFALFTACEDQIEPNITPMAEFVFFIEDEAGNPVPDATVYLFPFQNLYTEYKNSNLDGQVAGAPNVASDNVALSGTDGRAFFPARDLQGNGFASGTSWIYRPNAIYVRVEATVQGNFLTNDDDSNSTRISFEELGSGDVITVTTPVVLK